VIECENQETLTTFPTFRDESFKDLLFPQQAQKTMGSYTDPCRGILGYLGSYSTPVQSIRISFEIEKDISRGRGW